MDGIRLIRRVGFLKATRRSAGRYRRSVSGATALEFGLIMPVFLLLIFFVYTHQNEILEAHMNVNLPSPVRPENTEKPPPPNAILELEVHPGQVLLQGVPRDTAALAKTLKYLADLDPDVTVLVKTSVMTKTRELVQILDLCKGVGFTQLNVVKLK